METCVVGLLNGMECLGIIQGGNGRTDVSAHNGECKKLDFLQCMMFYPMRNSFAWWSPYGQSEEQEEKIFMGIFFIAHYHHITFIQLFFNDLQVLGMPKGSVINSCSSSSR